MKKFEKLLALILNCSISSFRVELETMQQEDIFEFIELKNIFKEEYEEACASHNTVDLPEKQGLEYHEVDL